MADGVELSAGKAFLVAYLPAQRAIEAGKRALFAKRGLSPSYARAAQQRIENGAARRDGAAIVAKVDERLANIFAEAGLTWLGSPIDDEGIAVWLDALADTVRPHLSTAVLEAAWEAGAEARRVTTAVSLLVEVTRFRVEGPDDAKLRASAAELARELKESVTTLRARFEATGLPLVIAFAGFHAEQVELTRDLESPTTNVLANSRILAKDLDSFSESAADRLDVAPPPKVMAPPVGSPSRIEEESLLTRIVAAPYDVGSRLRLAELLEPRNDPRARLIRLQLSSFDDAGRQQAHELVLMHPEWKAPLETLGARDVEFDGGFPEAITVDAEVLLARASELFATAPLKRLHVRSAKGRVRDVVTSKFLATIKTLDLDDQGVTDDDVVALAASPYVSTLRQLDLRYNPISARGIEALAASRHLKNLLLVCLDGNPDDPVDRLEHYDEASSHFVPTDAGKALEAKYGAIRWLHRGTSPSAPTPPEVHATVEDPRITGLTKVLAQLGIASEPVLELVAAVGLHNVFVGFGTLSERVQLLVPSRPAALKLVAPTAVLPAARAMLLVCAQRDAPLTGALVIGGETTTADAVDQVAPGAGRHSWLPVVESLTGGSIKNRTRYLDEQRGTITLSFPTRDAEAERIFATELAALAIRLGAPATWQRVYEEAGPRVNLSVTTECGPAGPMPRLGFRFGTATWDRAIDLVKVMVDVERARGAAVRMGALAAAFRTDTLRGVDAVIDAADPDVMVWLELS